MSADAEIPTYSFSINNAVSTPRIEEVLISPSFGGSLAPSGRTAEGALDEELRDDVIAAIG